MTSSVDVTGMAKGITEYGIGTIAVAILFVMVIVLFGVLVKLVSDNNANHRKEMVPVLTALTESLDTLSETQKTLSETQMVLKEQLVEKVGNVSRQVETNQTLLKAHIKDCSRLEATVLQLQPSILKTEERTKTCVERRNDVHI